MEETNSHIVGAGTESQVFEGAENIALAQAACLGDVEGVRAALQAGANPNASGREGMTPVRWALRCASLTGVEELLRAGGEPVPCAVMDAAQVGNADFLRLLLRAGADPNARDQESPWSAYASHLAWDFRTRGGTGTTPS
ncbi:MAG: ankyrin repeat domain-containing protein [Terricaulis sp.]